MANRLTDADLVMRLKTRAELGNEKAAAKFGCQLSAFRASLQEARKRGLTASTPVLTELDKTKAKVKTLEAALRSAQQEQESAEAIRREIFKIAAYDPEPPKWLTRGGKLGTRGMPTYFGSDWHYGEVVRGAEVGGVNEFNSEIAAKRIRRGAETTVDLAYNHMGRVKTVYPGIVFALGGDLMSGDIHEELMVTNDRTPQQCVNELTDLIAANIELFATKFGRVFVPAVTGNHGRSTRKPRMKGRVWCLAADTPILTRDLRWVEAKTLRANDPLLAFEEEPAGQQGRRYMTAYVTQAASKQARTIAITLEDGRTLYATPEHKFLAHGKKGNSAVQWISAQEMLDHWAGDRKNKAVWKIDQYLPVWKEDRSYEAGFLAAAFDGEGCLSRRHGTAQLSFNQTENAMLETVQRLLSELGFEWHTSIQAGNQAEHRKTRHAIYISGGHSEIARFLGTVRPPRLLKKWAEFAVGTAYLYKTKQLAITRVQEGGVREITELSSSSGTYLSAGVASHNTSYEWNIYCNLARHFRNNKQIAFKIADGADIRYSVYNHRYLLTHGDNLGVRGGDGIIGALGPIMRGSIKIRNSESQIGQDFDTVLMGHWHQYITLPGLIVNNSLKGLDEFAHLALRAPYSRPSQALWFTHPEHGITAHWQVYLEPPRTQQAKPKLLTWEE